MPIAINGSGPITGITSLNTMVSDTELGYLDGVTSAIQTQINTNVPGMVLVASTSLAGAGTISINNCFSTTYDSYRIVVQHTGALAAFNDLWFRVRSGGTDLTSSVYGWWYMYVSAAAGPSRVGSTGVDRAYIGYTSDKYGHTVLDISNPMLARETVATGLQYVQTGSSVQSGSVSAFVNNTSTYDGFTIGLNASNYTATIRVYGLKN